MAARNDDLNGSKSEDFWGGQDADLQSSAGGSGGGGPLIPPPSYDPSQPGGGALLPSKAGGAGSAGAAAAGPPSGATVPQGPAVDAADDDITTTEDDTTSGSLLVDNGNGTDTAPLGTEVFVTAVNGAPFQDTAVVSTTFGGLFAVDSEGNFVFDPGTGYQFLDDGEEFVETFTYTLSGFTGTFEPGEFDAVVDLSALTSAEGFQLVGNLPDDFAGVSVARAGDVNQDGFDDLVVGAYRAGAGFEGEAYVVFGGDSLGGLISVTDPAVARFQGAQPEQLLGQAVGGGGDYNGDGIADVLIASPRYDTAGTVNAGRVDVLYGGQGQGAALQSGFSIVGFGQNDYAGIAVGNAGDINDDGIDDILVSAWPADPGGLFEAGEVYVIFGVDAGVTGEINVGDLSGQIGFTIAGAETGERAGSAVSAAGDFNGDGVEDLIIGASHADNGAIEDAGAAYVFFGRDSFSGAAGVENADFTLTGIAEDDYLGRSVTSAGDINNDGFDDIAVGAFNADGGAGAVYVVFGGDSLPEELSAGDLNGQNGFVIEGLDGTGQLGVSVSSAGDVNADGIDDLLIGAHLEDGSAGAAYVVFGRDGGFGAGIDVEDLDGTNGFSITGAPSGSYLGWAVSAAGDVNGDGVDDIVVTAFGTGDDQGSTFVIYGRGTPIIGESTATVTVTIAGANDAPLTAADDFVLSEDDSSLSGILSGTANLLDNDSDPDDEPLTILSFDGVDITGTQTFTTSSGATITISDDGTFDYAPGASAQALGDGDQIVETFSYDVTDGTVTVTSSVTVTVDGVNDAPVVSGEAFVLDEDDIDLASVLSGSPNVLDNDTDAESDALTVSAVNGSAANVGTSFTTASGATVLLNADGTFNYVNGSGAQALDDGESLTDTITYTVSDGTTTSTASIDIIVNGANDAPSAVDDGFTMTEDDATLADALGASANVTDNDVDVDVEDLTVTSFNGLTFTGSTTVTSQQGATVTIFADGTFDYDAGSLDLDFLDNGDSLTDSFTYTVTDGSVSDTATITVTINGVNDAPDAINDNYVLFENDGSLSNIQSGAVNLLDNDSDVESDPLTIVAVDGVAFTGSTTITTSLGSTVQISDDGTFDYIIGSSFQSLDDGESLNDTVTYTVSDGDATTTAVVTLIINGTNDAPDAVGDAFALSEDDATLADALGASANVLDNDDDVDGDAFTVSAVNGGTFTGSTSVTSQQGAAVTIFSDGTFDYDISALDLDFLDDGDTLTDIFTYTITDGDATDTATIVVTINGVNDAPVANANSYSVNEDDGFLSNPQSGTVNVLSNDTDVENDVLIAVEADGVAFNDSISGTTALGSGYVLSSDGSFDYAIADALQSLDNGESITDVITYTISDGDLTATSTITLTIFGSNDGPSAAADTNSTLTSTEVRDNVLDNDSDVDGDDITVSAVNGSAGNVNNFVTLASGALIFIDAEGNYTFDPNGAYTSLSPGDTATEVINYTISDGDLQSSSTLTITISAANPTSVEAVNDEFILNTDTGSRISDDVTVNDLPDSSVTVWSVNGETADVGQSITLFSGATVTLNQDGTFTYDNSRLEGVPADIVVFDSFSYRLDDGSGESGNGPVTDVDDSELAILIEPDSQGEYIGYDVEVIGDINGDGIADLAITAPYGFNPDGNQLGKVFIVFGSDSNPAFSQGAVDLSALDGSNGFYLFGDQPGQRLGGEVKGLGDVNGDDIDDFAVTTFSFDEGQLVESTGVYVIYGRDVPGGDNFAALESVTDLDGSNGFKVVNENTNVLFGHSIAGGGDVNGDGLNDIIVGSLNDDGAGNSGTQEGRAYVVFGSDQDRQVSYTIQELLTATEAQSILASDNNSSATNYFGASVALGDVNGDGFADIIVGADPYSEAAFYDETPTVYVIYGSLSFPAGGETDASALDGSDGFLITGADTDFGFGIAVASGGDFDGDGIDDIIIGSPYSSAGLDNDSGKAYVIYGADPSQGEAFNAVERVEDLVGAQGFEFVGDGGQGGIGRAVDFLGDTNGDGFDEAGFGGGNIVEGELSFVLFGTDDLPSETFYVFAINGENGVVIYNENGLATLGGGGDINDDGFDDLIVGDASDAEDFGQNESGVVYIAFGRAEIGNDIAQGQVYIPLVSSDGPINDITDASQVNMAVSGESGGGRPYWELVENAFAERLELFRFDDDREARELSPYVDAQDVVRPAEETWSSPTDGIFGLVKKFVSLLNDLKAELASDDEDQADGVEAQAASGGSGPVLEEDGIIDAKPAYWDLLDEFPPVDNDDFG